MSGWRFPKYLEERAQEQQRAEPRSPFMVMFDGASERGILLSHALASITGGEDSLTLTMETGRTSWPGNPLDHLDEAFARAADEAHRLGHPGACFAGVYHYDLRRSIEKFGHPAPEDRDLPWISWFLFARVSPWTIRRSLVTSSPFLDAGKSSLERPAYEVAVRAILEHERRGDVYQVNLTRLVECPSPGDAFVQWQELAAGADAPFSAFANFGDLRILSLSPERFLSRNGHLAWTEPIKGTIRRGETTEEDLANLSLLLSGEKEAAELAMIVDVERNDLGRVAVPGSVRLAAHRQVLPLPNVHHLISRVEAELRPGTGIADLLRATFPGGSVTGAPKIRAMQIIDELEPISRGYYCGALGWMNLAGDFDLSLTIRTATEHEGVTRFGVGGGIVVDSDPGAEWEETVAKARCFVRSEE